MHSGSSTFDLGITYSLMTSGFMVGLIKVLPALQKTLDKDGLKLSITEEGILGNYPVLCFGIAAIGLTFACGGLAFYGCHQILLISALAAASAYPTMGGPGAVVAGVIFGTIAAIINDSETVFMNSGDVSHIDGPATAIFITTFIIKAIWG